MPVSAILFVVALVGAALALTALAALCLLSWRRKASRAPLSLLHRVGSVTVPLRPEGAVLVCGELWRARSLTGAQVGCGVSNVRVVAARGVLLEVEPLSRSSVEAWQK